MFESGRTARTAVRTWHPAVALTALIATDQLLGYAVVVLGPDLGRALGVGPHVLAGITLLRGVALLVATRWVVLAVERGAAHRTVIAAAFVWAAGLLATAAAADVWVLAPAVVAAGAALATAAAAHRPMLAALYPRGGVLAVHRVVGRVGNIAAPLLVALLSAAAGLAWRSVFVVFGGLAAALALVCVGLGPVVVTPAPLLPDRLARLMERPAVRRLLGVFLVVVLGEVPLYVYALYSVTERYGMGVAGRGVLVAAFETVALAANAALLSRREGVLELDVTTLVLGSGTALLVASGALAASLAVSTLAMTIALLLVSMVAFSAVVPILWITTLAVADGRAHGSASRVLAGAAALGVVLLVAGDRIDAGVTTALAVIAVAVAGCGAAVVGAARAIGRADVTG